MNKRRRIIVHHDNASSHTSAQTSAFLTDQNVELMGTALTWHPMTSFCSRTSREKCVVNDYRRQKILLKRLKTCFGGVVEECLDNWFERMHV